MGWAIKYASRGLVYSLYHWLTDFSPRSRLDGFGTRMWRSETCRPPPRKRFFRSGANGTNQAEAIWWGHDAVDGCEILHLGWLKQLIMGETAYQLLGGFTTIHCIIHLGKWLQPYLTSPKGRWWVGEIIPKWPKSSGLGSTRISADSYIIYI